MIGPSLSLLPIWSRQSGKRPATTSLQFRGEHPEIPWAAIVGLRHRVVHDYMHVDLDIVWDVVTNDLSTLVAQLEQFEAEP